MQHVDPDDPRLKQRPIWGLVILTLPIVGIVLVFLLYGAMWALGMSGRAARGPRAELAFDACAEARPLLEARVADMGLADTRWRDTPGGFAVELTLTGDPEVDARLPDTLAMPGALEVLGEGEVLATSADITDAGVRLDLLMVPSVLLKLRDEAAQRVKDHVRAHPGGELRFRVDGVDVGGQSNLEPVAVGDLELAPDGFDTSKDRELMHTVAAWSVVLDHAPLPCEVTPSRAP